MRHSNDDSPSIEAKDGLGHVESDPLGESRNVSVESTAHELVIGKDEGLLHVEASRDDVLGVSLSVAHDLLNCSLFREEEFLICIKELVFLQRFNENLAIETTHHLST